MGGRGALVPVVLMFVHSAPALASGSASIRAHELASAPLVDGQEIGTVAFAAAMDFTADGRLLIYDAFNEIPLAGGSTIGPWSVFALDLVANRPLSLIDPTPGVNVGNPALSQASDTFLLVDVRPRRARSWSG
jgi:hypothetical protein